MAVITVGITIDPDDGTATINIDGSEFILHNETDAKQAEKNIQSLFYMLRSSDVWKKEKSADVNI